MTYKKKFYKKSPIKKYYKKQCYKKNYWSQYGYLHKATEYWSNTVRIRIHDIDCRLSRKSFLAVEEKKMCFFHFHFSIEKN